VRYSERLANNDIVASVGAKGDSFHNAMAEWFNGLYKWELTLADVESPPSSTSTGSTTGAPKGEIESGPGFTTPAAYEADHYRQTVSAEPAKTQITEPQ